MIASDVSDEVLQDWRQRWDTSNEVNSQLLAVAADIASQESCQRLADVARHRFGRIDILINCAGWFPMVSFEEMTVDQWRQVIDVNLTGTFLVTKAAVPLMKDHGWGRIINFGSGSLFDGTADQSHYVAAKAGVLGFSRSLARELGVYGITVNVITPGLTVTKAVKDTFPAEILEAQRIRRALHRDEVAEDLVGPVFFLASDDAGFITGQTLNVDGGQHLL